MHIRRLTSQTGAEATGIDLTTPIAPDTKTALNRAFIEHSVLVIRNQTLNPPQLLAAVELFGPVFPQHNTRFAIPECPQIHYISNQDRFPDGTRYIPGEGWHTDHSNDTRPPKATALHAVTLPDRGGDTQFANMAAAYAALPRTMQNRIAGLMAIHVYQSSHSARQLMGLSDANKERNRSTSTRSGSRGLLGWITKRRCRCWMNCLRTQRGRNFSIGTNGGRAIW